MLNGGRLAVAPAHQLSLAELGEVIARHRVTTLWLSAALFHQFVEGHLDSLRSVRQLLAGGDLLSAPRVRRTLEGLPACTLINGYGPTENTTFSTCHAMKSPAQTGAAVSIGRPIANSRVVLLDRRLRPVAIGVAGQLCVAGDGLARGYFDRAGLTAENFVPAPGGGRLYLTGDLARYLGDGTIDFLGRLDHQVKIRGFRIEPGEIESVLAQQPGIEAAVVIPHQVSSRDKRLVAYVVAQEPRPAVSELRRLLADKLPEHMVPSAFLFLDALPLTPNGKVERQALPAPRWQAESDYVAPRTPLEELVAGVWSQVLDLDRVGAHDSFFELGGHSLLATQVVSRLRESLGVELPLRRLFDAPTVAALARIVEAVRSRGVEEPDGDLSIRPIPRDGELPLSFAQERLWILDRLEPGNVAYSMPSSMRLRGDLAVVVLERSLNEVVRRHEGLRTTFASTGGRPFQTVNPSQRLELPSVDLRSVDAARREREVERLSTQEAATSFDLARGPLIRVRLLRLAEEEHVLLLNMHHIVSDGWSINVLAREMTGLYKVFFHGETSPLPELAVQYADYAYWQRQWLSGRVLERQLAYWRKQLADLPRGVQLPSDRPRPALRTYRGAHRSLTLSQALSQKLEALSRRRGATLFMTLLAAFKVLFYRLAGEDDFAVGTPVAGRNRSEAEALIGVFLNTLVLRTDLSGNPTFSDLLGRVREVTVGAYAHQDLPFEKLLDELQPQRDLSRTPFFQVFFNMFNLPFEEMRLPGLSIESLAAPEFPSKFDLTIYAGQGDGVIGFRLVYNANLFTAARIAELGRQYELLLSQMVEDPEVGIDRFSLCTAGARALLPDPLEELGAQWHGAVHELFSRRAERAPEHLAVSDPAGVWSYRELEEQS
ncbi:MAG: condensation domain-containing protein, partial [Acidobacteriota bacterium]